MVMQPTSYSGIMDNQTIEISQESLRSVLHQIEANLMDSEVYRRTMAGLQTMLGEASSTAQILIKAVGREAVRLTFQEIARQYKVVPVPTEKNHPTNPSEYEFSQRIENLTQEELDSAHSSWQEGTSLEQIIQPPSSVSRPKGEPQPHKKANKAELAEQKAAQEREERLRQVGYQLMQARQAKSLSIDQLHRQTLVPPHQIVALEAGRLDLLPEDVYIRGFIRRIAFALGLNGAMMIDSIPEPDLVKAAVPSWHNSIPMPGFQINSMHLYIGYTALIAGAVGGLSLMSKQASPGVTAAPEPASSSQSTLSPKAESTAANTKPGLQSGTAGVKAGGDIAPPEAIQ